MLVPYSWNYQDDAYIFKTENGLEYKAYFMPYEQIPDSPVRIFQFSFEEVNNNSAPYDPRIELTIVHFLQEFFIRYDDALLLITDNTDLRAKQRRRLFERWYHHADSQLAKHLVTIEAYGSTNEALVIYRTETDFKKQIKQFFSL